MIQYSRLVSPPLSIVARGSPLLGYRFSYPQPHPENRPNWLVDGDQLASTRTLNLFTVRINSCQTPFVSRLTVALRTTYICTPHEGNPLNPAANRPADLVPSFAVFQMARPTLLFSNNDVRGRDLISLGLLWETTRASPRGHHYAHREHRRMRKGQTPAGRRCTGTWHRGCAAFLERIKACKVLLVGAFRRCAAIPLDL